LGQIYISCVEAFSKSRKDNLLSIDEDAFSQCLGDSIDCAVMKSYSGMDPGSSTRCRLVRPSLLIGVCSRKMNLSLL
jgi:hypothetical protein